MQDASAAVQRWSIFGNFRKPDVQWLIFLYEPAGRLADTYLVTVTLLSTTLVSNEWLERPSYKGFRPVTSFTIN